MKVTELKENEVINCSTKKEANEICKLMHKAGLNCCDWYFYGENYWNVYKEMTCYDVKGTFCSKLGNYVQCCKVYSAKYFLRESNLNKILNESN